MYLMVKALILTKKMQVCSSWLHDSIQTRHLGTEQVYEFF